MNVSLGEGTGFGNWLAASFLESVIEYQRMVYSRGSQAMFGLRKRGKDGGKGKTGASSGKNRNTTARGYSKSPIRTARKLFHGVSICPAEGNVCDAARNLEGTRFLADDAPMLPLSDCSNPAGCRCKYQHYDDRRTEARRESDVGLPMKDHPNDARSGPGRRVTDG
jgi:hypothetical protein